MSEDLNMPHFQGKTASSSHFILHLKVAGSAACRRYQLYYSLLLRLDREIEEELTMLRYTITEWAFNKMPLSIFHTFFCQYLRLFEPYHHGDYTIRTYCIFYLANFDPEHDVLVDATIFDVLLTNSRRCRTCRFKVRLALPRRVSQSRKENLKTDSQTCLIRSAMSRPKSRLTM